MYLRLLKISIVTSLCVFVFIHSYCGKSLAESNEPGTYLGAEDWDIGTPPPNFPECGGPSWHDWDPKDYDCDMGNEAELSNSIFYTPPRSFRNVRTAGRAGSMDLSYDISPPQTKIHIRMYVYFGSSLSDCGSGGREDIIHFLFFNTARSGVNFGVDLRTWNDWGTGEWPPQCSKSGPDLYFQFHSYHDDGNPPCSGRETSKGSYSDKCWNILDHLEEWHSVEFMWDLENHEAKMWIDGDLKIDRTIYVCNHSSINRVILSMWNSCRSCRTRAHDVFIDNIVVSDQYIGPIGGMDNPPGPPDSPSGLKVQ